MKKLVLLFLFSPYLLLSQELTVEQIWKDYAFNGKYFGGFRSMKDGIHYTQMEENSSGQYLVKYSLKEATAGVTIVPAEKLVLDGKPLPIDDYSFNENETKILLTTKTEAIYRHSYSCVYYLYDMSTGKLQALDNTRQPQTLAEYSPDGKSISYLYKNDLYVKEIASGKVRQITTDGKRNKVINGTTDWVYEEEFGFIKGYYWSPDSKSIAYLKFVEKEVPSFTIQLYKGDLYPSPVTFKYPKAGEVNSAVSLHIVNASGGKDKTISLGTYEYIPRMKWSPKENKLIVLTLNRHQNELNYHLIDVASKKTASTIFFSEKSETYIDIDDNLLILRDGKTILRTSESDGYNHIYAVDFSGKSTQLTKGNWDVIEFHGINEDEGKLYYSSAENGTTSKSIYRMDLKGENKQLISEKTGYSHAQFTSGMKYFVKYYSTLNTPTVFTLCTNDGTTVKVLESNEELITKLNSLQLPKKEFTTFKSGSYDLNAWVLKPANFDPSKKYPVYVTIYCGPGHNEVLDQWSGQNYMYHQLLAQKGYIVVSVDSRGTQYRGAAFKKSTYLQLGKLETEDILAVAEELKKLPYVAPDRIGIQGWSFGGFMTSLAMTKGKGAFKMGIAVAPVTNWKWYDNIYTERFMRTPSENPAGYDDNSPVNFAKDLQGKYLIIHGSADDNVHYQNAMEMIRALISANKQFDQFVYPNKNHGIYGGNTRNHLYNLMLSYTLENL